MLTGGVCTPNLTITGRLRYPGYPSYLFSGGLESRSFLSFSLTGPCWSDCIEIICPCPLCHLLLNHRNARLGIRVVCLLFTVSTAIHRVGDRDRDRKSIITISTFTDVQARL